MTHYDLAFDALMIREGIDYDDEHDPAHQGRNDDLFTRYGITPAEQLAPGGDSAKRAIYGLFPGFSISSAKQYYFGEHYQPLVKLLPSDVHDAVLECLFDVSVHSGAGTAARYARQYGKHLPNSGNYKAALDWWDGFWYRRLLRYERITRTRIEKAKDSEELEKRWVHYRGWAGRLLKLSKSLFLGGPLSEDWPGNLPSAQDLDQTIAVAVPPEMPAVALPKAAPVEQPVVKSEPNQPEPVRAKQPKWLRWLKIGGTAAVAGGVSAAAPVVAVIDQVAPVITAIADGVSIKDAFVSGLGGLVMFFRDKQKHG